MIDMAAAKMEEFVKMLITTSTMKHVSGKTKYVDIVKDVLNIAPVHWIANEIVSSVPSTYSVDSLTRIYSADWSSCEE